MPVVVEQTRIRRAWARGGETGPLALRLRHTGGSALDLDTLNRCVLAANEAGFVQWLSDGQCTVSSTDVMSGPDGPVVILGLAETRDGLLGWLQVLADGLEAAGWAGKVDPAPFDEPDVVREGTVAMTALLSLAEPGRVTDWGEVLRWAVPWVALDEPDVHVASGFLAWRSTPAAALRLQARDRGLLRVLSSSDREHLRVVSLDAIGRVVVQLKNDGPWQSELDELRDLVAEHAGELCYAGIRYSAGPADDTLDALAVYPPKLSSSEVREYYRRERWADGSTVPDAMGTMLLTGDHLARARDLSGWSVQEVGPDRWLVQADDLAAWFAQDRPDPHVLEAAREDLDGLILQTRPLP